MVKRLLEKKAGVDLAMNDGTTPLFMAVTNGHDAVVVQLLKAGANGDLLDSLAEKNCEKQTDKCYRTDPKTAKTDKKGWFGLKCKGQRKIYKKPDNSKTYYRGTCK